LKQQARYNNEENVFVFGKVEGAMMIFEQSEGFIT
jgi:hypothetical protein